MKYSRWMTWPSATITSKILLKPPFSTPALRNNLNQILDELADDLRKIEINFDYRLK